MFTQNALSKQMACVACISLHGCSHVPEFQEPSPPVLFFSDLCRFTSRDLESADWMKSTVSWDRSEFTLCHFLFFFSPPSARFCGSEFSRVRRLRKYNPQMSAGRLRYQKYPPGQLHSQGEFRNCCKAATPVWSKSSR